MLSLVRSTRVGLASSLAIAAVLGLGACASNGSADASGASSHPLSSADPTTDLRNPDLHSGVRAKAAARLWNEVETGALDRSVARDTLKAVAWPVNNPEELRLAALNTLFADRDGDSDSRTLTRLMLPHGGGSQAVGSGVDDVTSLLAMTAAERGWTDCGPAIVRSYARFNISVDDQDRIERKALLKLYPSKTIDQIVYSVFLDPKTDPGPQTIRFDERTRTDAWNLLARLDPTGELRARLILDPPTDSVAASTRPMLAALRDALRDFHVVPITGDELQWLADTHAHDPAWWAQAASAVRQLPGSTHLEFRHVEPIRWASINQPAWLRASQDELLSNLESHQEQGTIIERRADRTKDGRRRGERVDDWLDTLSWADALTLTVVERAVHDPAIIEQLRQQIVLDRKDTTTEYGGVLEAVGTDGFDAILYPPRPSQRLNDTTFVASQDMIDQSDTALAHYHFHAQHRSNDQYAGPSLGDLKYAARSGRTCVVFTTVGKDRMDIDVYSPDGSVVDLGAVDLEP